MLSNYPDDFDHSLLDGDEDDLEKLSCGCYEEACECPQCEFCGERITPDDEEVCPNECEDDEE
jgi:hypothetical protein